MTGTRRLMARKSQATSSPFARGIATGLAPHSYKSIWIKELPLSALVHVLMSYPPARGPAGVVAVEVGKALGIVPDHRVEIECLRIVEIRIGDRRGRG
jgi:hypothetical protein